ncbi:MAG TPA: hypothetical protein VJM11_01865, partial [Nevskiaceae bacterium]|nr:hypothetical protein [Nevskiaceae bacterium]
TRSLFDHLLAQNDGLPYPFEKLVAIIQRGDPENRPPLAVMIPDGRSLLKASANFQAPRVVFAADYHAPDTQAALGIVPRGQLFLGFVENANEIEVISYNELAGRYEFQLVQNYCEGCNPRIVYARRAICQTCHQGGSPIFSVRPWQETNAQPEIAARIVAARGEAPYLAVATTQPLSAPERIDELTDVGNFVNVTQRMWLDACGAEGAECRRAMLRAALRFANDPPAFDPHHADADKLRALQREGLGASTIPVPGNDLASRDPLLDTRTLGGRLRALLTPELDPSQKAKSNEDLEAFERLPPLPPELDPLVARPPKKHLTADDLDGAYGIAQLFSPADLRLLLQAGGFTWDPVLEGVDRLPADALGPQPFSRVRILQALLAPGVIHDVRKDPPARTVPAYCCLDTAEMSPPEASGVPGLAIAPGSVLQHYDAYCFACHRGNPAKRLNFMAGPTEAAVLESIKAKGTIRDALDWERYRGTEQAAKMMPPQDSSQRAALEAAMKDNPKLLEEMRSVVPALFDF